MNSTSRRITLMRNKPKKLHGLICAVALSMLAASITKGAGNSPGNKPDETDRAAWMDDAKFGLFIHWGIYSQLKDGEWVMFRRKMPISEYELLAKTFNPVKFNADEWVKVAKDSGMKYIVITSKHHDGFAMFDSKVSDYNIVKATPFKRDPMMELSVACKKAGIKLGFYYSHAQDWYHPGGAIHAKKSWDPAQAGDFQTYLKEISIPQIKELVSTYDPAILWFDTPWQMTSKDGYMVVDAVRTINSKTLINSRLMYHGGQVRRLKPTQLAELKEMGIDYLSYRDKTIPEKSPWKHWETCMTLNHSWGYSDHDFNWKTPETVIRQLVEVVSKGGTFLLNVGPTAEGVIPEDSVKILAEVGDWLKINGEAIYGAKPTELEGVGKLSTESLDQLKAQEKASGKTGTLKKRKVKPEMVYEWLATGKAGKIYIHLFKWPTNPFVIEEFKGQVSKVYLLSARGKHLKFKQTGSILTVGLPSEPTGGLVPVLCLELNQ